MWDVEQFAKSECVYCFCFWIKFIQSISLICLILISFSIGSLILKSVRARFTWLIIDVPAWWYPFVNETFPILWMGRWRAIEWPARSPDLNPLNFFTKLLQSQCIFFLIGPIVFCRWARTSEEKCILWNSITFLHELRNLIKIDYRNWRKILMNLKKYHFV